MNRTNVEWTDYASKPILARRKTGGKVGWFCVNLSPGFGCAVRLLAWNLLVK